MQEETKKIKLYIKEVSALVKIISIKTDFQQLVFKNKYKKLRKIKHKVITII